MSDAREILHLDMDAFYASVEQRDRPELRGLPVIVGSPPNQRGVVSTCSYEARRFGVRSAMPSSEAGRLCPQGIFLPVDMPRYLAVSRRMHAILERFTPLIEPIACDEAFLDVTGAQRLFGTAVEIGRKLRAAIATELQLTASVGVAGNKFLAKLCSELAKPDGLLQAPREREAILAFLAPLPVGRLWGVGKVLRATLEQHGYRTIGDLQRLSRACLTSLTGPHVADHLLRLAHGDDPREVETGQKELSISREHTFLVDCRDRALLRTTLRDLVEDVGQRLRASGRFATVGRIKLRWSNFKTITRQRPLTPAACDDITLRELALALFEAEPLLQAVRLIGFGVSGLVDERSAEQPDLFTFAADQPSQRERRERLSQTIDQLRANLGEKSVRRADTT